MKKFRLTSLAALSLLVVSSFTPALAQRQARPGQSSSSVGQHQSARPGNGSHGMGSNAPSGNVRPGNNNGHGNGSHDNNGNHGGNGQYRPGDNHNNNGHGNNGHVNNGNNGHGWGNGNHNVQPVRPSAPVQSVRPGHPTAPIGSVSAPVRPGRPVLGVWTRPVPPTGWRPVNQRPLLSNVLGLAYGLAFNTALNSLYSNGYTVSNYNSQEIYLNNVNQLGYFWPSATLFFNGGYLSYSQYYDATSYYSLNRYNNVFASLCNSYGAPVSQNGLTSTWFGYNGDYITLDYRASGAYYYTVLTIGN